MNDCKSLEVCLSMQVESLWRDCIIKQFCAEQKSTRGKKQTKEVEYFYSHSELSRK